MAKIEPNNKPAESIPNFEVRLQRLRELVDELEKGDLPLEKTIEKYEEGVRVLKTCADTLAKARLRVDELTRDADGVLELKQAQDLEDAANGGDGDDER
jgi:exodeoxyribonuclease VII small subunit